MLSQNAIRRIVSLRKRLKEAPPPFVLSDFLFTEQLAFVTDPAPNKVAVCSRRSGKTIACAADLIHTAISENDVVCLYITLSRNNAKKIIWPELKKINRLYNLGGELNTTELSIAFPNGSIIYCSGAKDSNEIEKFRGMALKKVYIDEAQSFRSYIKELIDEVLSAALMDYAGTLVLIGTPGPVPTGYFYDCAMKNNTWSKHKWTFWNNPHIVKKSKLSHQESLDRELKRRGVTLLDPAIQREWYGEWTLDDNSLLVHYDPSKNNFATLPEIKRPDEWNYILGIDLGFDDADALAILAWCNTDPGTYLVEEKIVTKQGITELVEQIQTLNKTYKFSKMVIDQGGLGKKIAEEIRVRHSLPVHPADKMRKMENIEFLNDTLRTGRFKAKADSKFAQDSYLVEIDWEKSTPEKKKVSDRYHSDIIDAVLYAFRESPAYSYVKPVEPVKFGSREWAEQQEDAMFEAEMAAIQAKEELERRINGEY